MSTTRLDLVLAKLEAAFPELLVGKVREAYTNWQQGEDVELGFGQDEPSSASIGVRPNGLGFVALFTTRKQWLELGTIYRNGTHMCLDYHVKGNKVFKREVDAIMRELKVNPYNPMD